MTHPHTCQRLGSSNPRANTDRVRQPCDAEISDPSPIPRKIPLIRYFLNVIKSLIFENTRLQTEVNDYSRLRTENIMDIEAMEVLLYKCWASCKKSKPCQRK